MKRHRQMTCADGYKKPKKARKQQLVGREPRREWQPGPLPTLLVRVRVGEPPNSKYELARRPRIINHPVSRG